MLWTEKQRSTVPHCEMWIFEAAPTKISVHKFELGVSKWVGKLLVLNGGKLLHSVSWKI